MSSTVRITKKDKQELENLINYLNYKGKSKITQEQMISLLIDAGIKRKHELLEQILKPENDYDWKNDPIFSLIEIKLDENSSETVDDIVYGD
nr:hypothetical protein [Candidatus Prometheoarchaeum syntrophicum]QEE16141.1 hypothetical protein DSAG12_01970 [Candidatus Prometheoarchaeum syntrophicum]